jgi:hypothetical protein
MGALRLRFPLWMLLLAVLVSALLLDGAIGSWRQAAKSRCRSQASYHTQREQDHLGCISEDLGLALACARQAARGAPIPRVDVFIQPSSSSSCAWESKLARPDGLLIWVSSAGDCAWESKQEHQCTERISINSGRPIASVWGPPGGSTIFWTKESVWWITEAARDWRRAAWHGRMRRKWEQAASSPRLSASPDPTEP